MTRLPAAVIAVLMLGPALNAQTAKDGPELTRLLKEFLAGASRNDAAAHDRFWAEELVYTGSSGRRIGKADILRDLRSAPPPRPGEPTTTYGAEDIRIQQYGDIAVVAFRLTGTTERAGNTEVANYLNTGTFLKRGGRWQVVSWQATRVPRAEEAARKGAAAAGAAFWKAILDADVKTLGSLMDDGFIWTDRAGERMTGKELLEQLGSGKRGVSKLETGDVTVAVHGDTAVVRGASSTLTLVNTGAGWKAVAMHTSR
jgi:ketosteroid isomerase-like protein